MTMQLTRRSLLSSAAPVIALAAAGCATTTNPTTGVVTIGLSPAVTDFIQSAVAAAAQYIPTVESIAATAAGLFGPAYSAIVEAGSAALNTVIAALTAAANTLAPAAGARMRARLRASAPSAPVTIGTTPSGVVVMGYRV